MERPMQDGAEPAFDVRLPVGRHLDLMLRFPRIHGMVVGDLVEQALAELPVRHRGCPPKLHAAGELAVIGNAANPSIQRSPSPTASQSSFR